MPNKYASSGRFIDYKRDHSNQTFDHKDKILKIVEKNFSKTKKFLSKPLSSIDYYVCFDDDYSFYCDFWGSVETAKKLGSYLRYHNKYNIFVDQHGNEVDVKGKKILAQSAAMTSLEQMEGMEEPHYRQFLRKIENAGGINLCSADDTIKLENWFNYCKVHRKQEEVTAKDLRNKDTLNRLINEYSIDGKVFIKTVLKDFHKLFTVESLLEENNLFERTLNEIEDNIKFLVSQPVKKIEDELGNLETRFVVIEDEVVSASRYTNAVTHKIDKEMLKFANSVVKKMKENKDFPNTYCLDIFKIEGKDNKPMYDVVEFNPLVGSGGYVNTFVFKEVKDCFKNNIEEAGISLRAYHDSRYIELFKNLSSNKIDDYVPSDLRGYVGKTYEGIIFEEMVKDFKPVSDTYKAPKTDEEIKAENLKRAINSMNSNKEILGEDYMKFMQLHDIKLLKKEGYISKEEADAELEIRRKEKEQEEKENNEREI